MYKAFAIDDIAPIARQCAGRTKNGRCNKTGRKFINSRWACAAHEIYVQCLKDK